MKSLESNLDEGGWSEEDEPQEEELSLEEPQIFSRPRAARRVDPDAAKVIRRLLRYGYEAFLVGGGVRDLLLGREPKDFDIATSARPTEVRDLFRNCRVIGRRFRLAHVLFGGGKIIEVATFRTNPQQLAAEELEAAARSAEEVDLFIRRDNVFGEPHEDARRRDFTINGLFYDIENGEVIDYVGGVDDLDRRLIRTIGAPDVRFREDPIRMMRAIKFSARLDLGLAASLYDALIYTRGELAKASAPRLLEEVLRLLRGGASHRSFWLAWDTGLLGVFLPELSFYLDDDGPEARALWGRLSAIDEMVGQGELPSDTVLFAALLKGPIEDALRDVRDPREAYHETMMRIAERLALPRRMRERMRTILGAQHRLESGKLGSLTRREYFEDAAKLFAIEKRAHGEPLPEWWEQRPRAVARAEGPRRRPRRPRRK